MMATVGTPGRSDRDPVVITGIGSVSPLGSSFAEIATGLLAGRSGIREVEPGEFAREQRQFAAPVTDIPPPPVEVCGLDAAGFAALDRLEQLCLAPLAAAAADAGLVPAAAGGSGPRIGLVLGLGAEHLKRWEADFLGGGDRVFQPCRQRPLVQTLAARLGIRGPAVTVAAACASSGYALALGRAWIRAGWVDACLAGGCDILSPTALAAFYNLRALSRRSDDPAPARPWATWPRPAPSGSRSAPPPTASRSAPPRACPATSSAVPPPSRRWPAWRRSIARPCRPR